MRGVEAPAEQHPPGRECPSQKPDTSGCAGSVPPLGDDPAGGSIRDRLPRGAPRPQSVCPTRSDPGGADGRAGAFAAQGPRSPGSTLGEHQGDAGPDFDSARPPSAPRARPDVAAQRNDQQAGDQSAARAEPPPRRSAADGGSGCELPPTLPHGPDLTGGHCVELDRACGPMAGASPTARPHLLSGAGSGDAPLMSDSVGELPVRRVFETQSFGSAESIPTQQPSPNDGVLGSWQGSDLLLLPPRPAAAPGEWRGRREGRAGLDDQQVQGNHGVVVRALGELAAEAGGTPLADDGVGPSAESPGSEGAAGGRVLSTHGPRFTRSDSFDRHYAPSHLWGGVGEHLAGPAPMPSPEGAPHGSHTGPTLPATLVDAADATPLGEHSHTAGARRVGRGQEPTGADQGHVVASLGSAPFDGTSTASDAASRPSGAGHAPSGSLRRTPMSLPSVSTSVAAAAVAVGESQARQRCAEQDSLATEAPDPAMGDADATRPHSGSERGAHATTRVSTQVQPPPLVPIVRTGAVTQGGVRCDETASLDTAPQPGCVGAPTGTEAGERPQDSATPQSQSGPSVGHSTGGATPHTSDGDSPAAPNRTLSRPAQCGCGTVSISVQTPSRQPESATGRSEGDGASRHLHALDHADTPARQGSGAGTPFFAVSGRRPCLCRLFLPNSSPLRVALQVLTAAAVVTREIAAPAGPGPFAITCASLALMGSLLCMRQESGAGGTQGGEGRKSPLQGAPAPGSSLPVLLEVPPLLVPGPTAESRSRLWTTLVRMLTVPPLSHPAAERGCGRGQERSIVAAGAADRAVQPSVAQCVMDAVCVACSCLSVPLDAVEPRMASWTAEWAVSPELAPTLGLILLSSVTHSVCHPSADAPATPTLETARCPLWVAAASSIRAVVALSARASPNGAAVPRWRVAPLPYGAGQGVGGAAVVEVNTASSARRAQSGPDTARGRGASTSPGWHRPPAGGAREGVPGGPGGEEATGLEEEEEPGLGDSAVWISVPMRVSALSVSHFLMDSAARALRASIGLWACTAEGGSPDEWHLLLRVPSTPLWERYNPGDSAPPARPHAAAAWAAPANSPPHTLSATAHSRDATGASKPGPWSEGERESSCAAPDRSRTRRTQSSGATQRSDGVAVLASDEGSQGEEEEGGGDAESNTRTVSACSSGYRVERAAAHSAVPFPQGRGEDPNSELEGAWDLPVYQRRQSADGSHALPERCTSSGSLLSRAPRVFGSLYEEQDQVPTTPASPDAQRHASKDSSPSRTKPRALLVPSGARRSRGRRGGA